MLNGARSGLGEAALFATHAPSVAATAITAIVRGQVAIPDRTRAGGVARMAGMMVAPERHEDGPEVLS